MINKTKHTMQTAFFLLSLLALQGTTVCPPTQNTDTNNSLLNPHVTIQMPQEELLGQFEYCIYKSDSEYFKSLLSKHRQEISEHIPELKLRSINQLRTAKQNRKFMQNCAALFGAWGISMDLICGGPDRTLFHILTLITSGPVSAMALIDSYKMAPVERATEINKMLNSIPPAE